MPNCGRMAWKWRGVEVAIWWSIPGRGYDGGAGDTRARAVDSGRRELMIRGQGPAFG